MSCSIVSEINLSTNVIQAQVCTALAHNSDHVGVDREDLDGLVPNDVQKGFKTVKKSPYFSRCATGCAMPQLGGKKLSACNF